MLSPACHKRIVARFGREGKPDNARKSRIFNNLGLAFGAGRYGSGSIAGPMPKRRAPAVARDCRPCGMRRGYDSHSPRHRHFRTSRANSDAKPVHARRSRRDFHDQRQRHASRGGPSSPVERAGAVHQGPFIRKSERPGLAGAAAAATLDQYPDQCQCEQCCRKRVRSDAFGRRQGGKRRQGDVQLRSRLCRRVPHPERTEGKPSSAGHD